jgi:MFS family permease
LLFADAGLSDVQISSLLLIWTAVGIVAEVPSGALADRFSRRGALAAAGVFQAAGYVLWTAVPGYTAFAAGFVLWGLGGALGSGALEALLYDGLASVGGEAHYPKVYARVTAVSLLSQLPTAVAATVLFAAGGYPLVGWASVATCLAAAAVATRLPETRPGAAEDVDRDDDGPGYLAVLRAGVGEAARHPAVRAALVAVAVIGGLDAIDEYFPLLARDWGVATPAIPGAMVAIALAGAAGAALGGAASRLRPRTLAAILALAVAGFCAAALVHRPLAMAGMALAYGLYRLVLVVTDTRLQSQIEGASRATVTSVASLGTELTAAVFVAAWAVDRPWLVALIALGAAAALPLLLRARPRNAEPAPEPIG